jgi:hypothetical protein
LSMNFQQIHLLGFRCQIGIEGCLGYGRRSIGVRWMQMMKGEVI